MRYQTYYKILEQLGAENGQLAYPVLVRIEKSAQQAAENHCNIPNYNWERRVAQIEKCVVKVFGKLPNGFFVNGDPRGCGLKIDPDVEPDVYGLFTDWGGFGILAKRF